ncbi:hemolysin D [Oceanicola sp. 22II-s10i]|uniref:efflux RND transporter periplasmic adaptor subunit n=1 Tax=Oceanicola sp. 22II-s10i TaxID=1317116 RepID=UPI000B51FBBD|nr:efflux RND transporter periplasmic adaptor subunit [Oceanicola sp. 22II-s10i]OWU82965.1 hemolysin D [Oceanicola sp. 22II-s10i]
MRLLPVLTAILVAATLYVVIMHRDALTAFANGASAAEAVEMAKAENDAPAERAAAPARTIKVEHKPVGVIAVHSEAREIDGAVLLRGATEAARQVELRAETSGRVISEPIRRGANVEEDQIVCELDPGTRDASLAEAQARLAEARASVPSSEARVEEAKAQLEEARINENAAVKLSADGYASDTRVASARAGVRSAEAAVATAESGLATVNAAIQSAEAAVAAATREIDRLTIKAPFGGLLETDTAELGTLLQPGGLCATIIQLDPIKIVGYIPETEVARVERGARAGARLAAGGGEVIGQVTFLSRSADPQTRTFRVEIEVPNPDLRIRDGQTAEIGIEAAGAKAHLLPQSALTLNDEGTLGVSIVTADNMADFVPVQMMRDTVQGVWLTGLPDKADVIIIGQEYVVPGVAVAPTYREQTE